MPRAFTGENGTERTTKGEGNTPIARGKAPSFHVTILNAKLRGKEVRRFMVLRRIYQKKNEKRKTTMTMRTMTMMRAVLQWR